MTDYEIGYGKPPKHSQFKKNAPSPNPAGRPKRKVLATPEIVNSVLNRWATYQENGRTKTSSTLELALRKHIQLAIRGNLSSARAILEMRSWARKHGDMGVTKIIVANWFPDYRGQTAAEKNASSKIFYVKKR